MPKGNLPLAGLVSKSVRPGQVWTSAVLGVAGSPSSQCG